MRKGQPFTVESDVLVLKEGVESFECANLNVQACERGGETMESKPKDGAKGQKKRYVKPQVRQVPLRPAEAVLGWCKVVGGSGPAAAECAPLCYDAGS